MLDWNQYLNLVVTLNEEDWGSMDDYTFILESHSYDLLQENNWKAGGDFSKRSSDGIFTIYWRVVVEQLAH
jgi:hypothetical protein